jgi:hypothetical protein
MVHNLEVQGGKKFRATQRTARVTALYGMYHPYDVPPDLRGDIFQFWHDNWRFMSRKSNKKLPRFSAYWTVFSRDGIIL